MPSVLYCIYPPTFSNCEARKELIKLVEDGVNAVADIVGGLTDMSIDIPFPAISLFVKLLYEISILPVPSKLVPAIVLTFASLSAFSANGCLYVDNICNLLVVVLLENCAVSRDDNKLRDEILSAVPANGCLYVDNTCNLLVVALLENCVVSWDDNKLRDVIPSAVVAVVAVSAAPANGCLYVDNICKVYLWLCY